MAWLKTSEKWEFRTLYIVLLSVAGALLVLLLTGTIFALLRPANSAPIVTLGGESRQSSSISAGNSDIRVFSGTGRLRIPLVNDSIMVLSISFPYLATDTAFTEELAVKISDLRSITYDYFASLPKESIVFIDEDAAKAEILRRFNSNLRLGRIDALYFSDFMVID